MAVDAFGIEKEFLSDLLRQSADGRAQLPEFQRGWVWPMENIRALLSSISLGYPVGTIMMLTTGGDVRFKERPIEGAAPKTGTRAERLILDGQQRMTSLFQALLLGQPIVTQDIRKRKLRGWFYIDIMDAVDDNLDREDAIRFVPADRLIRNFRGEVDFDLSTAEREYELHMFPVSSIFDWDDWMDGYVEHWGYGKEVNVRKKNFTRAVLKQFERYQMPVIELARGLKRRSREV